MPDELLLQAAAATGKGMGGSAMIGWRTLFYKEILRFWKVGFQTVGAPVLTSILYLLVFGHVLEDRVKVYDTVCVHRVSGARAW